MVGFRQKVQISDIFSPKTVLTKVLFIEGFTLQNFHLSLLCLNNSQLRKRLRQKFCHVKQSMNSILSLNDI